MSESTQPTLQLFADMSGDLTLAISDAPSPVDHSWVFKIQIGSEQMLVQEPGTTVFDDWNILARGADGTLEQSHAQGTPIQFLGEACCDAGWDFLPNQPETSPTPDIIAGTAVVPGPELVVDPRRRSSPRSRSPSTIGRWEIRPRSPSSRSPLIVN